MNLHAQELYDAFIEKRPVYQLVEKKAKELVQKLLEDNQLYIVALESRVKAASSLAGKLDLKGYKYDSLSDITDLVGIRIVTFYADEVDRVSALVESVFSVDWENSVDKRKLYHNENSDRFGYMSLHYIVRIPKSQYYDPDYPELNEIRFEIQMRTALQHVWATAYHDTGYKSDVEVPGKYLRQMSQLAGLLEITDNAFGRILMEITEYRRNVKKLVVNGDFDSLSLDGDTFYSYLEVNPFQDLNQKIAGINRSELVPAASYEKYLTLLKHLQFETIGDLVRMKKQYSEMAYQLALIQLVNTDLDILSESIALHNLCLCYLYDHGANVFTIKEFYDVINGERKHNIKLAERTIKQLEKIYVI